MGRKEERYRCDVCGQEVVVVKDGPGRLYCCGQPMVRVETKPDAGIA
jgi:desulfoferrodoxin-like iron-binding protein